ncbi:hypothetical protein CJ485_05740 [Priestia filamentosa]|nr:hypothetical protein CJ485_05740 [Priestia filamentosa]
MEETYMLVGIIGGGIGGLTLAQALREANINVIVFERDQKPTQTGGYRLHLHADALNSLRKVLPQKLMEALLSSGTGKESFTKFSLMDHHGNTKLSFPVEEEEVLMIGRVPLRTILASNLDHIIHWNTVFSHYEEKKDRVVVHFSNQESVEVDVLVGADGVHSAVANQLLGKKSAKSADTAAIAGKVPLTVEVKKLLPNELFHGPAFAVGPKGIGMFLTVHNQLKSTGNELAQNESPYIVWSVGAPSSFFHNKLSSRELQNEALSLISKWDISYQKLVSLSPAQNIAFFHFYFPAALEPWRNSKVTVIGDAIHPMPPTGGVGASTAIIDAVNLAQNLANRDQISLALKAYQSEMLHYAPQAVDEARPPLFWQRRFANPVIRTFAMSCFLPLAHQSILIKDRLRRKKAKEKKAAN